MIVAPHLLGGVYAWGSAALSIAALGVLAMALWATRRRPELGHEPLVYVLLAMVVITGLHALPLPSGLARLVAPEAYADVLSVSRALGLPEPSWVSYTRSPAGTWERLLFGVAALGAFCAARILSAASDSSAPLLTAVGLSTLGIAVSHLGHQVLRLTRVYGIYLPKYALAAKGPLLNPNNLAGFLAFGVPICLGLALRRGGATRWMWFATATVVAGTGLLAGSRAGFVGLVGGALIYGVLYREGQRRQRAGSRGNARSRSRRSSFSGLQVAVLGLLSASSALGLAYVAADDFIDVEYQDLTKLHLIHREAASLLEDTRAAFAGVGRGAFRVALSPVVDTPLRVEHAECLPLQYAYEFGIPFAAIALGIAGWRLAIVLRRWRSPVQLGGAVSIGIIGMLNLVDFSLELSGIVTPVMACFGAILTGVSDKSNESRGTWNASIVALALGTPLALGLAWPATHHDRQIVDGRLSVLANQAGEQPRFDEFWELFERSVVFDAAEASMSMFAGYVKVREGSADAGYWINRAMSQARGWPLPHMQAATWLAARGRWDQAQEELKTAAELDPLAAQRNLCGWLKSAPSATFALRISPPEGKERVDTLDRAAECLTKLDDRESALVDDAILALQPHHAAARIRQARRSIADGAYADAIAYMRSLRKWEPRSSVAVQVEATAWMKWGQPHNAVKLLKSALERTDDQQVILWELATALASARDAEGMRSTIDQLRMQAGSTSSATISVHLANCERILGNRARALAAMLEAHRLSADPYHLITIAQLAEELAQYDFALATWSNLCERFPTNATVCVNRDRLRAALHVAPYLIEHR